MTVTVETKEEEMGSLPIKPEDPSSYGCQILQEKTTLEAANDKTLPNDARLVWYIDNGVECIDLTRCKKTSQLSLICTMIVMVRVLFKELILDMAR